MAAPVARFSARLGLETLLLESMQVPRMQRLLGNSLIRNVRSIHNATRGTLFTKAPNLCIANSKYLTRRLSTNRALFSTSENSALEDFSALPNVEEKPKKYRAWAPADDVYMISHYPPKQITFREAIEKLRTQARWQHLPNRPYESRFLEITVHLNMKSGEDTVPAFSGLFVPPHPYQGFNKVICLAEGEAAERAKQSGASLVIGTEQFPDIESGDILLSDYDYCVATKAILPHLSKIKSFLREKFPNTKKGSAGDNIEEIVHRHRNGKKYRVLEPKGVIFLCPVGELGLSDEQNEENIRAFLNKIHEHKPPSHGPFITKVFLKGYRLHSYRLSFEDYLPKEKAQESTKVDQRTELERIEDELRELRAY